MMTRPNLRLERAGGYHHSVLQRLAVAHQRLYHAAIVFILRAQFRCGNHVIAVQRSIDAPSASSEEDVRNEGRKVVRNCFYRVHEQLIGGLG